MSGVLSTCVYLSACPVCVAGTCAGGERDAFACSSESRTVERPPASGTFLGSFLSTPSLSTDPLEFEDPAGLLCEGQTSPGASGISEVRALLTDGMCPNRLTLRTTIAGPFCAASSGNPIIDSTLGLPAPLATGIRGSIDLGKLLRLLGP